MAGNEWAASVNTDAFSAVFCFFLCLFYFVSWGVEAAILIIKRKTREDSTELKSMRSSCWGLTFGSQHSIRWFTKACSFSYKRTDTLFWPPKGLPHLYRPTKRQSCIHIINKIVSLQTFMSEIDPLVMTSCKNALCWWSNKYNSRSHPSVWLALRVVDLLPWW